MNNIVVIIIIIIVVVVVTFCYLSFYYHPLIYSSCQKASNKKFGQYVLGKKKIQMSMFQ